MQYTTQTIAIEHLQQAQQHSRYHNIATHYLTRLTHHPPTSPLGPEYKMTHVAGEMGTNKTHNMHSNPMVNKMRTERDSDAGAKVHDKKVNLNTFAKCNAAAAATTLDTTSTNKYVASVLKFFTLTNSCAITRSRPTIMLNPLA
jgi:hypothetical protein